MSRHDPVYIQRLMDLPYAGAARKEIVLNGWWNDADFESKRESPVKLIISYEGGYSVSDHGPSSIIIKSR